MRAFWPHNNRALGELLLHSNQRDKALKYLKIVEAEFKDMHIRYWLARTQANLAELHKREGDVAGLGAPEPSHPHHESAGGGLLGETL